MSKRAKAAAWGLPILGLIVLIASVALHRGPGDPDSATSSPDDLSDAEARAQADAAVTVHPIRKGSLESLDVQTLRSMPGLTEEQRTKILERAQALRARK